MKTLMTLEEAKKLVAGSEERKQELIGLMNGAIESQAQQGMRWAHLPTTANAIERDWLKDELVIHGFKVTNGNPAVTW